MEEEYTIDELIAYIRSIIWQLDNCKEMIDRLSVSNTTKRNVREADLRLNKIYGALNRYKEDAERGRRVSHKTIINDD